MHPSSFAPPPTPHDWLLPDWPTIAGVHAVFTSRTGGHSAEPWTSMNLGDHVGDLPQHVRANRVHLARCLNDWQQAQRPPDVPSAPVTPMFMQQVHGWAVHHLRPASAATDVIQADACISTHPGVACTIMVADCLPILLAHRSGLCVAAAHAGWRGLAGVSSPAMPLQQPQDRPCHGGIIEHLWQHWCRTVRTTTPGTAHASAADIAAQSQVWLGPCIGPDAFEVGPEVRAAFTAHSPLAAQCFVPVAGSDRWRANLSALARQRLHALGLHTVHGNDGSNRWCTYTQGEKWFSHRRDAAKFGSTGRMAAVIWRE